MVCTAGASETAASAGVGTSTVRAGSGAGTEGVVTFAGGGGGGGEDMGTAAGAWVVWGDDGDDATTDASEEGSGAFGVSTAADGASETVASAGVGTSTVRAGSGAGTAGVVTSAGSGGGGGEDMGTAAGAWVVWGDDGDDATTDASEEGSGAFGVSTAADGASETVASCDGGGPSDAKAGPGADGPSVVELSSAA